MWVKWFEYSTLKTMDEDLAEEACILRRLWPGSIEKEKQRMNVEKEEKKKKCKVKLNRMRSNNHHQKDPKNMSQVSIIFPLALASLFAGFNSQAINLISAQGQGSSGDFKLMHPSGMILPTSSGLGLIGSVLRIRYGTTNSFPGYFGVPLQQNFWRFQRDLFCWLPARSSDRNRTFTPE
ncbi:hypothetical protein F2Q69_00021311 [Brassica cretica]|uniref:Uncharacterized protein n=1 Tax=Brassica cretica TaxID=69181 RepID=A0A8S9QAK2_BRACR|nr:hypothetical protein F2Q69_00021311 [Brassica cretica]